LSALAAAALLSLAACGDKNAAKDGSGQEGATGQAAGEAPKGGLFGGPKIAGAAKATVDLDVVGIKPGMTAADIKKQLEADGWRMTESRSNAVNVPGIEVYQLPATQTWFRAQQEAVGWRGESLEVDFTSALPGEEALAYKLDFARVIHPTEPSSNNLNSYNALQITTNYAVDSLAALKAKYGEPSSMQERTCNVRDDDVEQVIPTNRFEYARGENLKAVIAEFGRNCRQSLSILVQDSKLNAAQAERFAAYRSAQFEKAAGKGDANKKVDF
jgi:hypothetical protein